MRSRAAVSRRIPWFRITGIPGTGCSGPPCPDTSDEDLPLVSVAYQVCEGPACPPAKFLVEADLSELPLRYLARNFLKGLICVKSLSNFPGNCRWQG